MANRKQWSERSRKEKTTGIVGILILLFIIGSVVSGGSKTKKTADEAFGTGNSSQSTNANTNQATTNTAPTQAPATTTPTPPPTQPAVPAEYKSALSQATSYANDQHMSKQGVYDQLVSQYGGQFTAAAAQYAIDNVVADWDANALVEAKDYQSEQSMSPAAIHDQLTSAYGGQFTEAEADYAIQHLND